VKSPVFFRVYLKCQGSPDFTKIKNFMQAEEIRAYHLCSMKNEGKSANTEKTNTKQKKEYESDIKVQDFQRETGKRSGDRIYQKNAGCSSIIWLLPRFFFRLNL
jgi:hypothetical protein